MSTMQTYQGQCYFPEVCPMAPVHDSTHENMFYQLSTDVLLWAPQTSSEPSVIVIPNWRQRLWWLVANIILKPSAEGHEKMSVMIPHCELICSIQLICTCSYEDHDSSFSVGTHLPSWSALEHGTISPSSSSSSSSRQAMTSDLSGD